MLHSKAIKYDDTSWHDPAPDEVDDVYPAAVHMGMFLGWSIDAGLIDAQFEVSYSDDVARFKRREVTGMWLISACCDEKLTNEQLSDEGNQFALDYYENKDYFADFSATFEALGITDAPIADSWENYDMLKKVLDQRYAEWKARDIAAT